MATFNRIGVLAHPLRPQTAPIADEIAAYLQARGVEAWHDAQWDDAQVRARVESSDMVIAIGGDGSMLRAARVSS